MKRIAWMGLAAIVSTASCVGAQPAAPAKKFDMKPLSVTTSGLGNSFARGTGWGPNVEPSAQRWVMNWTDLMTVSPDGYVFASTTYRHEIERAHLCVSRARLEHGKGRRGSDYTASVFIKPSAKP